jgi:formate hydrogenlyase subunit 3/multisubunit Na+/H+ antiporter MnhD subunit
MPVLQEQPENVQYLLLLVVVVVVVFQESILNLFLFCESRNNNSFGLSLCNRSRCKRAQFALFNLSLEPAYFM